MANNYLKLYSIIFVLCIVLFSWTKEHLQDRQCMSFNDTNLDYKMKGLGVITIFIDDTINLKCSKIELTRLRLVNITNDSLIYNESLESLNSKFEKDIFNSYQYEIKKLLLPICDSIILKNRYDIVKKRILYNLPFYVNY